MLRLYLYARVRTSRALLHTRPRVQQAPGIPCALLSLGETICKARAECAAGMRRCVRAGRISMHLAGGRRNAAGDIRTIIGRAPGRHAEECRQHQGCHEQDHGRKMAHALASQPALNVQRTSTVCRVGKCSGADLNGVLPRLGWRSASWGRGPIHIVVPREGGGPSIPGATVIETKGRGVLDTRLRGYDGPSMARESGFASRPGMTGGGSGMTVSDRPDSPR